MFNGIEVVFNMITIEIDNYIAFPFHGYSNGD